MNPELKNLVDAALTDGYLTDKEKEVLRRKATKMGFDVEELDILLAARIHEENNKNRPKVNKCPNCGEIISGFGRTCPSCNYILNTTGQEDYETLEESFSDLEELVDDLKIEKKSPTAPIFWANAKILFTSGLFIIYKKLLRGHNIYDNYREINSEIIYATNAEADKLRRKYGTNAEVNDAINGLLKQRDAIIADRRKSDVKSGLTGLLITCGILCFFIYIANLPKAPLTGKERIEKLIEDKKIGEAKAMLVTLSAEDSKEFYSDEIQLLEVDSLADAHNYDEALRIVDLMKDEGYSDTRNKKLDEVVTKEVTELIKAKEFKRAKERAELATFLTSSNLKSQIELAEKLK